MTELINTNNIKTKVPKVPYLQYEILEIIFEGDKANIGTKVGFPKESLIVKSAIKSLIEKELLDSDLNLTNRGNLLLKTHYYERHTYPEYPHTLTKLGESYHSATLFDYVPSSNGNGNGNGNGNASDPIFRWYKYLEDFPQHFVSDCIKKYKISNEYYVLDPFSGSGTTLIRAKMDGYKSLGVDVNPAIVFIARQKLNWNIKTESIVKAYSQLVSEFLNTPEDKKKEALISSPLGKMPKKELNQWLSPVKQNETALMLNIIETLDDNEIKNLFKCLVTKTAVDVSYVAFCPGTTFYPFRKKPHFLTEFKKLVEWVISDLKVEQVVTNKHIESTIVEGSIKDELTLKDYKNKVDVIITSPPYPNDLEYTRQTRLEMYLLGYVKSMNDVQNVKRKMVKGSTKLIFNTDAPTANISEISSLKKITNELSEKLKDKNWGFDYPKMINMYFTDMYTCLANLHEVLVKDGVCILVVGDQTFKGIVIPVAEILAEISQMIGYRTSNIELHRERRSTGHDIPIPEENLILVK
ncbi:hypothetical protein B1772_06770 [Dehalococcoides mccartyi]|jgi:DNA modification methylase|uniref:DNA methyltransferase n=1 Tax=Dehalococcoides mccartyi TaxID=61435 RepID=UPI0008710D32|nr:DNA methyltransferase [Dehalococcoides mccartyi]AOV99952.1 DNA modification methyltransferase [Dehalococcoides mccartyi]AQX75170.1 hypothetical protein B1776_06460 [Dehalococcoides mccartyi]AQY73747.1 hypothetical protein B1772_06770 [Dehalococcoides mccartyi]BEL01447.1 hypothetical protein DMOBY_13000 [Dehalococcoides mccartyi]